MRIDRRHKLYSIRCSAHVHDAETAHGDRMTLTTAAAVRPVLLQLLHEADEITEELDGGDDAGQPAPGRSLAKVTR